VPYQLSVPISPELVTSDHYGGAFDPPITERLAFLAPRGQIAGAEIDVVEARAVAWNPERDTMYLAGLASDHVVVVNNATQIDPAEAFTSTLRSGCGADGLAITGRGTVLVWCSFTRSIERLAPKRRQITRGTELVASKLSDAVRKGRTLFHSTSMHTSMDGTTSCGSCHLDGRADGLSWMIHGEALQTPMLGGRIVGTAPYKWDGKAADLPTSVRATIDRLGGDGLSKSDLGLLVGFVEQLPAPRAPTRDAGSVARGKTLFESAELGCATCHDGPALTDRETHDLAGTFDTPGLVGLAASAPYFHDGSAATLEAALRDRGRVHGMSTAATTLNARDLADLVAFLETR
jgi:cytochrome c553